MKIVHSQLFQLVIRHSPLKQILHEALTEEDKEWEMNYVDYPHMCDLVNHRRKIGILVDDNER
jgi:hypothetical protein